MGVNKITVVGGGNTGITTAFLLMLKNLGDVVVIDLPQFTGAVKGKALDIFEAAPLLGSGARVVGTGDYRDTAASDLVIITAGLPRKPGMTRNDLVKANAEVIKSVVTEAVKYSPNAIILVLTNPVEIITHLAYKYSGLPRLKVLGQAGVLDGARFRTFVADDLNVKSEDVTTLVFGVHGDDMLPMTRISAVNSVPLENLVSPERLEELVRRTKGGGAEIVNLLGTGSAYFAPAAALTAMASSILRHENKLFSTVTNLDGEYGYRDVALNVPAVLGRGGIERIIDLPLTPAEKAVIDKSAAEVKGILAAYV
ncbi:MAG: malate dehydrogenase [Gracilibacteraceae bacterium]|jgi:malate dehydrogenase|nr:malate dehydrogenase [Gracilibacteraceae bacterium]